MRKKYHKVELYFDAINVECRGYKGYFQFSYIGHFNSIHKVLRKIKSIEKKGFDLSDWYCDSELWQKAIQNNSK